VTDLGTEFGVEVSREGNTTSHVFRGTIKLQVAPASGETEAITRVLRENETARVDSRGAKRITVLGPSAQAADFVRALPRLTIKTLDLADVVAGGNGFSGRRQSRHRPRSGRMVDAVPKEQLLLGDGKYHRVEGCPWWTESSFPTVRAVRCSSTRPAMSLLSFSQPRTRRRAM